MTNLRNSRI